MKQIEEDFGKNWSLPIESGYGWSNLRYTEWKVYEKTKWPNSRKFYGYYGKFRLDDTLKELNNQIDDDGIVRTLESDLVDDI